MQEIQHFASIGTGAAAYRCANDPGRAGTPGGLAADPDWCRHGLGLNRKRHAHMTLLTLHGLDGWEGLTMATRSVATVFGGSGFIGRYVVKRLARKGFVVRVGGRGPEGAMFLKPMGAVGQVVLLAAPVTNDAAVHRAVEGADVVVVSFGITSRVAMAAIEAARARGVKVGAARLVITWPFPAGRLREIARTAKAIVVPELNLGQMVLEVQRAVAGCAKVTGLPHAGGTVHEVDTILNAILEAAR